MTEGALLRRRGSDRRGHPYLLRPATLEDAPALVSLRDTVAAEGVWVAATPGERSAADERLALAGLLAAGGLAVVVEVDDRVVGQLTVARLRGPYLSHVAELGVSLAASHRDRGLGGALVETAIDWATATGVRRLTLSVFSDNARAIALYRRRGFVEEGVQRAAVRVDDVEHDVVVMALLR